MGAEMNEPKFNPRDLQGNKHVKAHHWEKMKSVGAGKLVRVTNPVDERNTAKGYFTIWTALAGKDTDEIRKTLGLKDTDLITGAFVYKLLRVPEPHEFEVRGYTTLPDGIPLKAGEKTDAAGFPAGTGALQYTLVNPVPAKLVCKLGPGEKLTLERFRSGAA
ncbi:hypothetical protein [Methylobacterium dankookense]|uniref:hypothetical protein n=1 Tax=Methylobacterium dankookense TaxID=560405 RepID=UPI0011A9CE3C|nr:hypothetical protein [Methylobacterium dankookense]